MSACLNKYLHSAFEPALLAVLYYDQRIHRIL